MLNVLVFSYNHEKYLNTCLESVSNQIFDNTFHCLIADDCSNDSSPQIIEHFIKRFPDLFSYIKRQENLGKFTGGNGRYNGLHAYSLVKSKYVAICDGDDYWTDPYKLQKQVDYLEANPCVSCCATRFNEIDNDAVKKTLFPNHKNIIRHDLVSVVSSNWLPVQTLTMIFRSDILQPKLHLLRNQKIYAGDYAMTVLLALKGDIHVLPDNTGDKRVDSGGVWESLHDSLKCKKLIETMDETSKFIPHKYKKLVAARITHHADYLLQNVATNGRDLFKTSMFLLKLHMRNRHITILCLKYIFNFTRVKLGRLKPHLF